jgi:phosphomethylpyrimidine synthase
MKISQEVREFAATQGIDGGDQAIEVGLKEKSAEFKSQGADLYKEV